MQEYLKEYEKWLSDSYISDEDKNILKNMSEEEKMDSFYTSLTFGTGGIRGKIGLGTNRMNIYLIRKVTQGIANYLLSNYFYLLGRSNLKTSTLVRLLIYLGFLYSKTLSSL